MAYQLNDIALITGGLVAPVAPDGDYCLAPFPLITHGRVVLEIPGSKLADPGTGGRFREPFDRGYYKWRYGSRRTIDRNTPEEPQERHRPNAMLRILEDDQARAGRAQALLDRARERELAGQVRQAQDVATQAQIDILALEAYLDAVTDEIADQLIGMIEAEGAALLAQAADVELLERNAAEAREALMWALEYARRHQNQMAAIEATIRLLF